MSTHNVCFHGEIRKNINFWLEKAPDLELSSVPVVLRYRDIHDSVDVWVCN